MTQHAHDLHRVISAVGRQDQYSETEEVPAPEYMYVLYIRNILDWGYLRLDFYRL